MNPNNPNHIPTIPNSTTKRKPKRNIQQNTLHNPNNYLQNHPNYLQQPTNFPANYLQESHQNYQPPFNPHNYSPNFYHGQSQPNFQYNPMSQSSYNEPISNSDVDEQNDDEDDEYDDEEGEFEIPCTQPNFTQLLTQQSTHSERNSQGRQTDKKIWSTAETVALISGYMNTSNDAITGTQQKVGVFWRRVVESYYAAGQANPEEISYRTPASLKSRWKRISEAVTKWCGSFDKAKGRRVSGQNDENVIEEAHKIHENSFGRFCFYDEWLLLKKWNNYRSILENPVYKPKRGRPSKAPVMDESVGTGSSGKRPRDEGDESSPNTPTSGPFADESIPRPEGVKKAKSRLKGKELANSELGSFGERLDLYGQVRDKSAEVEIQRLEFERQKEAKKEARKQKQLELEEKNIKMRQLQMNWDMLHQLLAKDVRAPWEERMIVELQKSLEQFQGF